MKTDFVVELLEISMDQLFSNCEETESLDIIYLAQYYRANPKAMNTILIPVKSVNSPTLSLSRVAPTHHYQALGNHHIFFARKKAQCPLARCLCLNRPEEQDEIWKTELQIQPGRPNITTMNQEELQEAFDCLIKSKRGKSLAKLLSHKKLTQILVDDPSLPYWPSLEPLKALASENPETVSRVEKKHIDCLDQYFRCDPQPLPPKLCINTASAEALRRHIKISLRGLGAREKVLPRLFHHGELLIQALVDDLTRHYWHSWQPFQDLVKALNIPIKIKKNHTDYLNKYFFFAPAPPPVPNTVHFLLQEMTVKELRHEAEERGLPCKGMKKLDLVCLLSSD